MGPDSEGYPEDDELVRKADLLNYHFSAQLIYLRDFFTVEDIAFFTEEMRVSDEIVRFTEHLFEFIFSAVYDTKRGATNIQRNTAGIAAKLCGNQEIFDNPATKKYIDGFNKEGADPHLYALAKNFIEDLKF